MLGINGFWILVLLRQKLPHFKRPMSKQMNKTNTCVNTTPVNSTEAVKYTEKISLFTSCYLVCFNNGIL